MKTLKKSNILIIIIFVVIICIFTICNLNNNNEIILDEITNEEEYKNVMAIMIEEKNEDGTYYYKKSNDKKWPIDMAFNSEKSRCLDKNGNKIEGALSYNPVTRIAKVNTTTTSYCYLYFDLDKEPPINNNVIINNGDACTAGANVTLTLISTGAKEMCISNTMSCTNYIPYETSKDYTLTSGFGSKTVYVYYRDLYGNISDVVLDTISICEIISAIPSQSESLIYNGNNQSPNWNNYDSNKLTIGGTTNGVNAGNYSATFTPNSNYMWSDGTQNAKTASWKIAKAQGSLNVPTILSLTTNRLEPVEVERLGTGRVSVTSSNTNVASLEMSGTTIKITAKNVGTSSITVSVAEDTNYTSSSKIINVNVSTAGPLPEYLINNSVSGLQKTKISGDELYRFAGTNGNVGINNYICLGTVNRCKSGTDSMYRIIGVNPTNKEIKVIKETTWNNGATYAWHSANEQTSWLASSLYTGTVAGIYNNLSFKNMIVANHSWNVGSSINTSIATRSTAIAEEKTATGTANIGIISTSDYYLAYNGDKEWDETAEWNTTTNWIGGYLNGNTTISEWTMNYLYYKILLMPRMIGDNGSSNINLYSSPLVIRPVFYLKSSINRVGGSGTSEDPFVVE